MWRETSLMTDRAVQFATDKTYVFSDSVVCLGGISTEPVKARESKIKWMLETRYLKDFDRIDGEQTEFEWKKFRGFTTLGILEIQKMMTESKCEPEHFKGRIIFMSMSNDIDWGKRGNRENCIANAHRVIEYARRFTRGQWSFLRPGSEKQWDGTHVSKPQLKSKGKGVKSIHFNGGDDTIELTLRTIISVNQLSVYGAVADLCGELARYSRGTGNPPRMRIWNQWRYGQKVMVEHEAGLVYEASPWAADKRAAEIVRLALVQLADWVPPRGVWLGTWRPQSCNRGSCPLWRRCILRSYMAICLQSNRLSCSVRADQALARVGRPCTNHRQNWHRTRSGGWQRRSDSVLRRMLGRGLRVS